MADSNQALAERKKYLSAFNRTMVNIWKEQIIRLGIIDTGRLLESVMVFKFKADGKMMDITLSQAFREYGLWQDYGTGKEVPRGNPGDIGRDKVRKRRIWFSKKYYASVMNLKEFMSYNLGREFISLVSNALTKKIVGQNFGKG